MASLHFGPGRVSIAPPGTDPNEPGWTAIGWVEPDALDHGLVYEQEPPIAWHAPAGPITITLKARISWFGYRWAFERTSPRARRLKREYHRRRR